MDPKVGLPIVWIPPRDHMSLGGLEIAAVITRVLSPTEFEARITHPRGQKYDRTIKMYTEYHGRYWKFVHE